MRIPGNNISTLVRDLNRINAQQAGISQQIASGSRLISLGSDAAAAGQGTQLATGIRTADAFVQTASRVNSRMQAADSAFGSVVSAVSSAITLAVQGSSATPNTSNLQAIAQQITGLRDQVVSLANASYQGSYLFAGTSGNTQPFVTANDGSVSYQGDAQAATITTHDGASISVSISGAQAFDAGNSGDIFAALNTVIKQLNSGMQVTPDALNTLRSAMDGITAARSSLDANIGRLTRASEFATAEKTQLSISQTTLISADTAKLATELSAGETQRSALMSTIAVTQKGSLFDYL